VNTLLIEHIPHKRCGKYANEIWQQDNYVHIFEIKQEIEQIKQGNKPFSQLYGDMQKKWDELDILQPNVTDPIKSKKEYIKSASFNYLLTWTVRSQILLSSPFPSIDKVAAIIEQEESRRRIMGVL
jgi:hypothetical protein